MKRIFEIIPGALTWLTFLFVILICIFYPKIAIYFIIIFLTYWIVKVTYWMIFLFISFKKFKEELKIDWYSKIKENPKFKEIYHLIFIPTYKEPYKVLYETFSSLYKALYPKEKMIIILACEERDRENAKKNALKILKNFGDKFYKIIVTFHPDPLKSNKKEIPGKGSNIAFAGEIAKKFIDKKNISYEKVIVSSFDADTQTHPQYFAYLTYQFINEKNPTHKSYQPIALFANNLWNAPWISRIVSTCTTFWLLTELSRPDRLFTFSSHSMSLKALVDVGFWERDVVTEDSRIFLQCFLKYNGNYQIKPLFIPISMDIVHTGSIINSLKDLYKQQRRWAYGIEHFPYLIEKFFLEKSKIKLKLKLKYLFIIFEGMYSWATAPIVILLASKLPFLTSENIHSTILGYKGGWILRILGIIGIIYIVILDFLYVKMIKIYFKNKISFGKYLTLIFQWILFPITFILWGSLPAVEAQTRLMLGKYLGFNVTKKIR